MKRRSGDRYVLWQCHPRCTVATIVVRVLVDASFAGFGKSRIYIVVSDRENFPHHLETSHDTTFQPSSISGGHLFEVSTKHVSSSRLFAVPRGARRAGLHPGGRGCEGTQNHLQGLL